MSIKEIEEAVATLSQKDYESFREWFAEFDMAQWDRQIEEDSKAGRLDTMINEALEDYHAGRATELKA